MQKDLDGYLETYNTRRPHRGRGMEGRTSYEVFKAGIPAKSPAHKKKARKGGQCQPRSSDLGEAGCQVNTVRKTRGENLGNKSGKFIQDCTICASCG